MKRLTRSPQCWGCPILVGRPCPAPRRPGNPRAYDFPRPFLRDESRIAFSFSGLKTAVRYAITGMGRCDFTTLHLPAQQVADLAASFQQAVVDCLVGKALLALRQTGLRRLCVGGGVAANRLFRHQLGEAMQCCRDGTARGAAGTLHR